MHSMYKVCCILISKLLSLTSLSVLAENQVFIVEGGCRADVRRLFAVVGHVEADSTLNFQIAHLLNKMG